MLSRLRARLTYANVIATVAMFVALGGSSYAALNLPKNAVGAAQLKKDSVRASEVKNGSLGLGEFKASERSRLRGPQGAQGAPGAQGLQGPQGLQGTAGTARAYGEVVVTGGNYALVPGTSKGVVAIAQGGGGNSAACIQLDSSIDAATAITVATPNNRNAGGQAFDTEVLIARPLAYCGGTLPNVTEVVTTTTGGGSVKRAFVFAVM
jgi:hypothetical protein